MAWGHKSPHGATLLLSFFYHACVEIFGYIFCHAYLTATFVIFQHGRKKQRFSLQRTDGELFTNMVLDDTWDDAELTTFFLFI